MILLVFTYCNNGMCDMFFLRRVICLLFSLFIIIQWVPSYIRIYRNYNNTYHRATWRVPEIFKYLATD